MTAPAASPWVRVPLFFCHDGDGVDTYRTLAEAKAKAQEAIDYYGDEAGEGWNDDSLNIVYGIVLGKVEITESRDATPDDSCWPDCSGYEERKLVEYPAPPADSPEGVDLCEVARELERVHAEHTINATAAAVQNFADPFRAGWISACEEVACRLNVKFVEPDLPASPPPAAVEREAEWPRECDWPAQPFTVRDEPDEHAPCWLIMPGGGMLAFNFHAKNGVDQARAKFIADACNARMEADDLLRDMGLDPARFRTEAGFLNPGKVRAAILHPDDYAALYAESDTAGLTIAKLTHSIEVMQSERDRLNTEVKTIGDAYVECNDARITAEAELAKVREVDDAMVQRATTAYFDALPPEGGESAHPDAMRAALLAALPPPCPGSAGRE